MSMFNDIEWWTKQNERKCLRNAVEVAKCARVVVGVFSDLAKKKSGTGHQPQQKPKEK